MRAAVRAACLGLLVVVGCDVPSVVTDPPLDPSLDADLRQALDRYGVLPIGPVPAGDPALVALGQALMFDPILSGNRDIACATCHHPRTHGGDGRSLPIGTGGSGLGPSRALGAGRELVPRNAPSLLNQGLRSFYLLWDGRVSGHGAGPFEAPPGVTFPAGVPNVLAAQAMIPVLDRREMRGEPGDVDVLGQPNELAVFADSQRSEIWQGIMGRLLAVPEYRARFGAAFPDVAAGALHFRHAAAALAAFITEGFTRASSPFDRYLAGDDGALDPAAKRGGVLFFGARPPATGQAGDAPFSATALPCSGCHGGPLLGGQSFSNVGAPQIGPGVGAASPLDLGRGGIGGSFPEFQDFYRFAFRAPPLRNVELTAPYMHSGAYATLEAVVRHYDDPAEALRTYDGSHLETAVRDRVHDDPATIDDVLLRLDPRLRQPLRLSDEEVEDLVAFLRSLTDPAARDLGDLVPASVPSGLPLDGE
ncbi:MAG TPA: cytochrome c peroxidase [Longimicrobiales bacterium]|nr:cytochrome c peroxidase [Longimicrobiales bacterium]